ncbi:hypothetical protein [Pararhizobium sp. LjRoot238]|uniref:hypothetical protein n=1 Tax=Pararhizobium sp. LjRoot238 TaxID=3342293 RepID=UPI003ECC74BA
MPNTIVPAAGESMPKISRRSILGGMVALVTPAAVAAASMPYAAKTDELPEPTLEERRDLLVAELGAVLQALTCTAWDVRNNRELGVVVMVDTHGKIEPEQSLSLVATRVSYRAFKAGV